MRRGLAARGHHDLGGQHPQLNVAFVGRRAQDRERSRGRALPLRHHDANGLIDDGPGAERFPQLRGQRHLLSMP